MPFGNEFLMKRTYFSIHPAFFILVRIPSIGAFFCRFFYSPVYFTHRLLALILLHSVSREERFAATVSLQLI
ncbi:hypothetical protein D9O50_12015 [Oxalobacteraceae bacterium CAVE-383]|nr:hypothetical protein D9O50_12015 [Oxalobacteraceae bacterium CAVE-383]